MNKKTFKGLDQFENVKNWFDTIIDSSFDGLWICDKDGNIIRINKAAETMNELKSIEVVGRNMRELVREGFFDKSITLEAIKKKTSVTMLQHTRTGKKILVTSNPIFNEEGEITFVVSNDRDITELDHLRSQLHETQDLMKRYSAKLSELEIKSEDPHSFVYHSKEMRQIYEMAVRVAKVDSTVLLLGESGVGKSILAHLIHQQSERVKGPFIRVDCVGIPDSLIESELFGYVKGAFTGARPEGKAGLFELANKGTLFLDEIGEIPLNIQSKLLRFLEKHEVNRVGGTGVKEIDVRIIAATNMNIEEMVSTKRFRADLYYRLNVVPIVIPPLSERRDDILSLLFYYLQKFNQKYQKEKTFSPAVIDLLCDFNFPGNVRELSNLIERMVVTTEKSYMELSDLPQGIINRIHQSDQNNYGIYENLSLKEASEKFELIMIGRTIKNYGSQKKASKILRVDQATISRKLNKRQSQCKMQ